jgi:hypothetical protein
MSERSDRERYRQARAPRYHAWLVRRWTGKGPGEPPDPSWRYSLEDAHTGARRGFATLADLVAYLQAEPGEDVAAQRPTS